MRKRKCTDEHIVAAIQTSPEERDWALRCLFLDKKLKNYVLKYVREKGGNNADGEDIFQEAIIKLDERVRAKAIDDSSKVRNYLQGIARNLWLRRLSNSKREELQAEVKVIRDVEASPEEDFIDQERINTIEEILEKIGKTCQQILTMYKLSYSMAEIADKLNFASPKVAKNEAYRCRKKFRTFVQEHPDYIDLLN